MFNWWNNNSVYALNNFRKGGARITFFTVGKLFEKGKDILQRQHDANHLVANHSWNHWSGYSMRPETRRNEVIRVQEYLENLLGEAAAYFRPPGGTYPPWMEAGIGLPIIQWSVDTYDYRGRPASAILRNIARNVRDGDIILMHDTGNILYKAIPDITQYLSSQGYLMVSLEELAVSNGVLMQPDTVYFQFHNGVFSERRDSNTN